MENLNKCWMCGRTKQELDNIADDFGFDDIDLHHSTSFHPGINLCGVCQDIIFTMISNGTVDDIIDVKLKEIHTKLMKIVDPNK